jgi:hypothetical protein
MSMSELKSSLSSLISSINVVRVELREDELAEERRVVPVVEIEREDMLLVDVAYGNIEGYNVHAYIPTWIV